MPSDDDTAHVFTSQVDQSAEAFITIDLEERTVFGRVGAADGSVYHISPNHEDEGHHVWIKSEKKDIREEEKDIIEVDRLVFYSLTLG